LFTFAGRISATREAPDVASFDEGIASAISKEKDAADGRLAADRKGEHGQKVKAPLLEEILAQKVAFLCQIQLPFLGL
jgi:hypothetical protein